MKARMEKYDTSTKEVKKRTSRNERLYNEVQNMTFDYVYINVNNAIDLSVSSNDSSREGYQKRRELDNLMPSSRERAVYQESTVSPSENRVYDIDEILKRARDESDSLDNDRKRLINTEYNILTKLDVGSLENEDYKKEDLRSLIDNIYEREKPAKPKTYSRKEEDRLLSDLFDDNPTSDDSSFLKEEISKQILDKEDSSVIEESKPVEKEDITIIEDNNDKKEESVHDDEVMEDFIEEKEGKGLLIAIIVVIILILLTCGFFVFDYFFGFKLF